MAATLIEADEVTRALKRVAAALRENSDHLTELDQAIGDGDLGITAGKVAAALDAYSDEAPGVDLGKYLVTAGMKINSAAPSSMGTLLAIGLMGAGKEARGMAALDGPVLAAMLKAADSAIQQKGNAQLGDKTIVDAISPAAAAFSAAIEGGQSLDQAGRAMVEAAQKGLEAVTPLRSRIGRASWVGERTENLIDPGCALAVIVLQALTGD